MKKIVSLPIPQLSRLKQVHLEFEMTGKHYEMMSTFQDDNPEQLMLAVLSDLVEEDVSLLTEEDVRYLFTLVKISNIGSQMTSNCQCQKCGKPLKVNFDLSKGNVVPLPDDYKKVKFKFKLKKDGEENDFEVLPCSMEVLIKFIDWFCDKAEVTRKQLYDNEHKGLLKSFEIKKALLWLTLGNQRIFDNVTDFEKMDEFLENNSYHDCAKLFFEVREIQKYGLQPCLSKVTCKECGGSNIFRLPLLFGFTM